jgi:NAD(P)-dependent dehydrogenase (short-subunit alcohol dehydrogenase family)
MTQSDNRDSSTPFAGLRVAITGGTSGLGLALVHEFLNRGALVAFVARHREGVERVAREQPGTYASSVTSPKSSRSTPWPCRS